MYSERVGALIPHYPYFRFGIQYCNSQKLTLVHGLVCTKYFTCILSFTSPNYFEINKIWGAEAASLRLRQPAGCEFKTGLL
jgi:hypothetical protein